jgi:arylsulfatase A-like enzyme/Tfp pilus assembly protein PilF
MFQRLFLTSLLLSSTLWAATTPRQQPNVILITIDTLRADHLGCYGYKNISTPSIDALARDGVRFANAYAVVPVTLPSHGTILTGTYPMYNGLHDFGGNKLNSQQPTLASVLRTRGYSTGAVVSAAVLDSRFGLNQGFDYYYDKFNAQPNVAVNPEETERPGNETMDLALAWLRQQQKHPFFAWIHIYDPHYPYRPPAPYSEQYRDHLYDGEIAFADAQVGRLVAYLRQNHLYDHTLIVLSGDHGEGLGEHGERTHGFFIYNSTLHVPLLIKPAVGTKTAKKVVSQDASLVDVMPTVLAMLHVPIPAVVQGRSLLAQMRASTRTGEDSAGLYSESFLARLHFNWSELRGLETGDYHFIDGTKPELYDRTQDPNELHNLYGDKPALAGAYQGKLSSIVSRYTPSHELAERTTLDPELEERLKSLGYAAVAGGENPALANQKLADPKDRVQMYDLVTDAIEDSQHERYGPSIEKLRQALATEKDSVPVHYLLALNYSRTEQFDNAIIEYQEVLELSPAYALEAGKLGHPLANAGNSDQAVTWMKKTLELDSSNFYANAAYNLGNSYLHEQKAAEAEAAFRRAITINPDYAVAHQALGLVLLHENQADAAIAEFRQAIRVAPQVASLHALLAQALRLKGLDEEAQSEDAKAAQLSRTP